MRIVIVGTGRMGLAVAAMAEARGHAVGLVGSAENPGGTGLTKARLGDADVAVEFTRPDAAVANVIALVDAGLPVVCGTTGWEAELPKVEALVDRQGGALLHGANFSVGVHLFLRAARQLAERMAGRREFDAFILEEHHRAKRDAPSGTARVLRERLRETDAAREYPITSVRAGATPGTHVLAYDGPDERIALTHVARSRRGFAAGALAAAEWLPGRKGVHTFEDMLFGGPG
ncbi:MAG TPA: dihydrodipicolinate reductase C-terminal domain-containing protein [Gemmatimonadales bacterium]|nr:dihydrodipicolinate reductase C-terminal domain-containing protein [Gemmatimonadales bacterium]